MTARLVLPPDAGAAVATALGRRWAEAVCGELGAGEPWRIEVALRPGVRDAAGIRQVGYDRWQTWAEAWRAAEATAVLGVEVLRGPVSREVVPRSMVVSGLDAALALVRAHGGDVPVDVGRGRRAAARLREDGAYLTPAALRAVCRLDAPDAAVVTGAVRWLREHPRLDAWTARQLPIPGAHSKWLAAHGSLLRTLTGRDVLGEVRARPAVAHLTYADPGYRASGARRHDAWTAGDTHELAYRPGTVLVVENRDCRLAFPPADDTVVVEGGGKAAAALLADVPWIREARTLVYWGDLDADGFAILDRFRAALEPREVASILMDEVVLSRYAHLGVTRDRRGRDIAPSDVRLPHLTPAEAGAYHALVTAGPAPVRRVEQERLPIEEAWAALSALQVR